MNTLVDRRERMVSMNDSSSTISARLLWTGVTNGLGVVVLLLMFAGCASPGYDTSFRVTLDGIVLPRTSSLTNWAGLPLPPSGSEHPSNRFEDSDLAAEWSLWDWNIKLVARNKTDQPMSILWAQARVAWRFHECALQTTDKRVAEIAVVQPGKSVSFHAFPRTLLMWNAWGDPRQDRGHWMAVGSSPPLFGQRYPADQKKKEILKIARKAVGHEVSILLPVVVRGERANYKFRLKVTDANAYHPWH